MTLSDPSSIGSLVSGLAVLVSLVYLARLSKAANDPERASKFYQEALAVPDASEQARKAAQTESQKISK